MLESEFGSPRIISPKPVSQKEVFIEIGLGDLPYWSNLEDRLEGLGELIFEVHFNNVGDGSIAASYAFLQDQFILRSISYCVPAHNTDGVASIHRVSKQLMEEVVPPETERAHEALEKLFQNDTTMRDLK